MQLGGGGGGVVCVRHSKRILTEGGERTCLSSSVLSLKDKSPVVLAYIEHVGH